MKRSCALRAGHDHDGQPCDPSEEAALRQFERDEGPDPRWVAMAVEAIQFRRDHDYLSGGDLAWRYMQAWRDVDFLLSRPAGPEDWSCIDCGIPLEPGAPPICSECVENGG